MKWHRNPFFHTAILPPSVAPSAIASVRPSIDIESATAAAVRGQTGSPRPSTDKHLSPKPHHLQQQLLHPHASSPGPPAQAGQPDLPRPSLQLDAPSDQPRRSVQLDTPSGQPRRSAQFDIPTGHHGSSSRPFHGSLLAEATARAASKTFRRRRTKLPRLTICEPTDRLTGYQFFYVFILDGLGAFLLSGGINFAIAYAMYKTQNTTLHPIRLFQFPNTLAGDAAVTIFLQTIITWFIELVLVNRDLRSGHVQPIGFISEPSHPLLRWFLLLDRRPQYHKENANTTEDAEPAARDAHDEDCRCGQHDERYTPGSLAHWAAFLVSQLLRAVLVGVVMFFLVWPPSIGILTAVGSHRSGDWWFDAPSWAPPIFKLIYGGILALATTPFFVAFWLVRCGWAVRANERHLAVAEAAAAVPT